VSADSGGCGGVGGGGGGGGGGDGASLATAAITASNTPRNITSTSASKRSQGERQQQGQGVIRFDTYTDGEAVTAWGEDRAWVVDKISETLYAVDYRDGVTTREEVPVSEIQRGHAAAVKHMQQEQREQEQLEREQREQQRADVVADHAEQDARITGGGARQPPKHTAGKDGVAMEDDDGDPDDESEPVTWSVTSCLRSRTY
jgi:hypothetical protein